jgi:hypothetical protein
VRDMDGKMFVWVVEGGKARRQDVQLGLRGRDSAQVLSGLEAGVSVVLRGQDRVSEGGEVVEVAVTREESGRKP